GTARRWGLCHLCFLLGSQVYSRLGSAGRGRSSFWLQGCARRRQQAAFGLVGELYRSGSCPDRRFNCVLGFVRGLHKDETVGRSRLRRLALMGRGRLNRSVDGGTLLLLA